MSNDKKGPVYRKIADEELQKRILDWWKKLDARSGARARLKRCASPEEAALLVETHLLKSILPGWVSYEASSTIAACLSHIKLNSSLEFPLALAKPKEKNGRVPFSETRFKQLISCREWDDFFTLMRRAIKMLDDRVDILSVADTILRWEDDRKGARYHAPGKTFKFEISQKYFVEAMKY